MKKTRPRLVLKLQNTKETEEILKAPNEENWYQPQST